MYNQTTRSYTNRNHSDSLDWITDGWDRHPTTRDEALSIADDIISQTIESDLHGLEDKAASLRYPVQLYSTSPESTIESPGEYIAYKTNEITSELKAERDEITDHIEEYMAQDSDE